MTTTNPRAATTNSSPSRRRKGGGCFSPFTLVLLLTLVVLVSACSTLDSSPTSAPPTNTPDSVPTNVFDDYLKTDAAPADGFDFPFGDGDGGGSYRDRATGKLYDGWYVATRFAELYSLGIHTGEDWNGAGGGDTDLGQDVFAVANGRVVFAEHCGRLWGNVVVVEHTFYENHEKQKIRSLYAHLLEIKVRRGEEVRRRQLIGSVGQDPEKLFNPHLHLELRRDASLAPTYWPSSNGKDQTWVREHYTEPSGFIRSHRTLPVPHRERALILVDQSSYKLRLYRGGKLSGEYDVSFGQGEGHKRVRGDNKTPKGMYFVIKKIRGEFDGDYGAYYGGHWIKINYPNKFDAAWGRDEGLVTPRQEAKIAASWERRAPTLEDTPLGGGIGFHGWIREWPDDGPRHLSWGCVVLHLKDIAAFYDAVPAEAMVVIF